MVLIFNPDSAFFRVEEYPMNWIKTTILMADYGLVYVSRTSARRPARDDDCLAVRAGDEFFFLTGFLTSWCCACIGRRKWMTASRRSSIELCMIWQCAPGCRCRAYI